MPIKKRKVATKKLVAKKKVVVKAKPKKLVKRAKIESKPISLEALFAEIDKVFADDTNHGQAYAYADHAVAQKEVPSDVEVSLDAIFKDILDEKEEGSKEKEESEVDAELSQLFDEIFADTGKKEITLEELFADIESQITKEETKVTPISLNELFAEVFAETEEKVTPAYSSVITSTSPVVSAVEKEGMEEMFRAIEEDEIKEAGTFRQFAFSIGVAVVAIAIAFSWFQVTSANFSKKQAESDAAIPAELQAEWQRVRNEARERQAEISNIISEAKSEIQKAQ